MTPMPSGLSTRPESFVPSGESSLRLRRAIESLALNLDDELYRYRQTRSGQGAAVSTPTRLQLRPNRKPIDLIAIKTTAPATATAPPPSTEHGQVLLGQDSVPTSQAYPPRAVNQVRLSHGGTLTTYRPVPDDYLESTEALLSSQPRRQPSQEEDEDSPSLLQQLTSPLGIGALLLLLVGSAGFGYLVTSPQAVSHLSDNLITRRIKGTPADGVAADGSQSELASGGETRFDPLGPDLSEQEFGSIDLSDLSTLPSANSPSPSASLASPAAETPAAEDAGPEGAASDLRAAEPAAPTPRPGVLTPAGGRPSSAVLRANIVNAPRAAAPTPAAPVRPAPARPVPAAPPAPAAAPATPPASLRVAPPAANARPPQPLARRAPAAPASPASPAAVAPPAPITQVPSQAATPNYYVVTDYSGAASLESARSAVGDAYVRDFSSGTRIQLGAFSQESSARNLANQLQGQGIPAQVISP